MPIDKPCKEMYIIAIKQQERQGQRMKVGPAGAANPGKNKKAHVCKGGRKMSNVNQHLTPDDLDRIPFPLDAGYRVVSRPAKNSVVIAPRKVGTLYTDDDFKALVAYAKPFGFTIARHGEKKGYAYVTAPLDRPYDWLGAFFSDGGAAEAARKQREQEEAEAKRKKEAQKEEEYRSLPSSTWIDENLGTEFANPHNRLMLARALDGVDKKFQGLISRFWLESLERLGFNPEQHGSDTDAVIAFLKRKYSMTLGGLR